MTSVVKLLDSMLLRRHLYEWFCYWIWQHNTHTNTNENNIEIKKKVRFLKIKSSNPVTNNKQKQGKRKYLRYTPFNFTTSNWNINDVTYAVKLFSCFFFFFFFKDIYKQMFLGIHNVNLIPMQTHTQICPFLV